MSLSIHPIEPGGPTREPVALIQLGIPGRGPIRDKVRPQSSRLFAKRAADKAKLYNATLEDIQRQVEGVEVAVVQLDRGAGQQRLVAAAAVGVVAQARGGSMRSNPIDLSDQELEAILISTLDG